MTAYRERLVPGPGTATALLLLLPGVFLAALPLSIEVAAVAAVLVTALAELVAFATAPVVSVTDGLLQAGRARIPVGLLGDVEAFRGDAARAARGPELDARAWTLLRGWVDPVARIQLRDPDDPAPYWVVSTRRPEELGAAIGASRAAGGVVT